MPAVATGGAMAFNSLHRVMVSVLAGPILVRAVRQVCLCDLTVCKTCANFPACSLWDQLTER